jgi:hypothetical protein
MQRLDVIAANTQRDRAQLRLPSCRQTFPAVNVKSGVLAAWRKAASRVKSLQMGVLKGRQRPALAAGATPRWQPGSQSTTGLSQGFAAWRDKRHRMLRQSLCKVNLEKWEMMRDGLGDCQLGEHRQDYLRVAPGGFRHHARG